MQEITTSGTIHNKVSEIAGKHKMQISDLARASGVSYDTAKRFWQGDAKGINWVTLSGFCQALNCTVGDLFVHVPENGGG